MDRQWLVILLKWIRVKTQCKGRIWAQTPGKWEWARLKFPSNFYLVLTRHVNSWCLIKSIVYEQITEQPRENRRELCVNPLRFCSLVYLHPQLAMLLVHFSPRCSFEQNSYFCDSFSLKPKNKCPSIYLTHIRASVLSNQLPHWDTPHYIRTEISVWNPGGTEIFSQCGETVTFLGSVVGKDGALRSGGLTTNQPYNLGQVLGFSLQNYKIRIWEHMISKSFQG